MFVTNGAPPRTLYPPSTHWALSFLTNHLTMRYLSLFGFLFLLIACNNRSSVTADAREPVYYDENEVITVPEPVETRVVEKQVPAAKNRPARTERMLPKTSVEGKTVNDRQKLNTDKARRLPQPKRKAPATGNQGAAQRPATKVEAAQTGAAPANPNNKVEPKRTPPQIRQPKAPRNTVAEVPQAPQVAEPSIAYPTHEVFDVLLKQYVNDKGQVDYAGLKSRRTALDKYLQQLENNAPDSSWPDDEVMAYWINAYNAYTLKLIVDNYPTKSIKELKGGKPWDAKWINIGGKSYSLNNIEHDILRKRFDDARIHAVVNCAAASCPPLWNRAFTADNLESALETRTRNWINNPAYNKISASSAQLSKLFDWYGEDFGDKVKFLNQYYKGGRVMNSASIGYLDYDWALNEQ